MKNLELELEVVQSYPLALAVLSKDYKDSKKPIRELCAKFGVRIHANKKIAETDVAKCELVLEMMLQKQGSHAKITEELFIMFYGGIQKLLRFYHQYEIFGVMVRKAERLILCQNDKWVDCRFLPADQVELITNAFIDEYMDYDSETWKEKSSEEKCQYIAEQHCKLMDGNNVEHCVNEMYHQCNKYGVEPQVIGGKYAEYLRQMQFRNTEAKYIVTFERFIGSGKWKSDFPIDPEIHLTDLAEHIEVAAFFEEVVMACSKGSENVVRATINEALKEKRLEEAKTKRASRKKKGA